MLSFSRFYLLSKVEVKSAETLVCAAAPGHRDLRGMLMVYRMKCC